MKSMTSVAIRLATLTLAKLIDKRRITLAVVRLNITRASMNFQNVVTAGTRPTRPYRIEPYTIGGTTLKGRISKRTYKKYMSIYCPEISSCLLPWKRSRLKGNNIHLLWRYC